MLNEIYIFAIFLLIINRKKVCKHMNKKIILSFVTVTSMIAVTGAALVINGGLNSSSAFATNGEVWYHYAAVAPTETTHGSKEFWASSADGCTTHTFTNPGVTCVEHDFSENVYFASLTCDDDRYVPSGNESLGITPMISTLNNTITYGLYPQTNVNDSTLVSALNDLTTPESNGWYLYNNDYYAKVSATPYNSSYVFDNGTTIVSGTTYWFKCELITWNVLSNSDGEYYILSNVLLDAHCYYDSDSNRTIGGKTIRPNNYEYSDIRTWLNNDFYNSAFALGNSYIQTTTVDNSASTTNSSSNPCVCNNTEDKVFLPSYQDYINSSYGFSTSTSSTDTRCCRTTDWTRARGAYYYKPNTFDPYNGYYWTRSPLDSDYTRASIVSIDGSLKDIYVYGFYGAYHSVRPAITVEIA